MPDDELLPNPVEGHSHRVVSIAGRAVGTLGSSGLASEAEASVGLAVAIVASGTIVVVDGVITTTDVVVVRSVVSEGLMSEVALRSPVLVPTELNDRVVAASETCGDCAFELRVSVNLLVYCSVLTLTSSCGCCCGCVFVDERTFEVDSTRSLFVPSNS